MIELTEEEAEARSLGLALLDASGVYENFVIPRMVGRLRRRPFPPHCRAIVGLVGRQRRFLRATYALADAGFGLEATALLRSMFEFHVCQLWLAHDPDQNWKIWMQDDHYQRDLWRERLHRHAPALHDAAVAALTPDQLKEAADIKAVRKRLDTDLGGRQRAPSLEQMAKEVGLSFLYDGIYRFESSAVVHPMMFGVDVFLEPTRGGLVLRPEPTNQYPPVPVYLNGATLLSEALSAAHAQVPSLHLPAVPDQVNRSLRSLAERRAEARVPNWMEVLPPEAFHES